MICITLQINSDWQKPRRAFCHPVIGDVKQ